MCPHGATCLPGDCRFSELLQHYKDLIKRVVLVDSVHHQILALNVTCSRHDMAEKSLGYAGNQIQNSSLYSQTCLCGNLY